MAEFKGRDRQDSTPVERIKRRIDSRAPLFAKLAPGPGKPPQAVAAHQRARIRGAMTEIVAEAGYDAVTVRELAHLAGVSTQAFYRHFDAKQECFLETYDQAIRAATKRIVAAARREDDWEERLRASVRACNEAIAQHPKAARLALIEAFAVGPPGLERMRRTFGLSEAIVRDGFAHSSDSTVVESLLVRGVVAGLISVARARLLENNQDELPPLTDELTGWMLCIAGIEIGALGRLAPRATRRALSRRYAEVPLATAEPAGDDRALILAAVIKLARTEPLGDISARRVHTAAGVSRRAFDKAFLGSLDCLLAAIDRVIRSAMERAMLAAAVAPTWSRGIYRVVASVCDQIAQDPSLARLGFTEALTLGPAALRQRVELTKELGKCLRAGGPRTGQPTEAAAEASVGGTWTILQHQISAGSVGSLPQFAPTLAAMVLAPAVGLDAALDEIQKEVETLSMA